MIKLRFEPQALSQLQLFIRHYEQAFYELYRDSGLWNEDLIIESYRQSARKIYLSILQQIEIRLGKAKILGRKPGDHLSELDFFVDNRLVVVHYYEGKNKKTRFIQSIAIDRKPIIF